MFMLSVTIKPTRPNVIFLNVVAHLNKHLGYAKKELSETNALAYSPKSSATKKTI
jgi:hypothetical protein